jgi:hypothetical protein
MRCGSSVAGDEIVPGDKNSHQKRKELRRKRVSQTDIGNATKGLIVIRSLADFASFFCFRFVFHSAMTGQSKGIGQ